MMNQSAVDTAGCFFCPSESFTAVYQEHGYTARRCNGCGTLYPSPFPDPETIDRATDLHESEWYTLSSPHRLKWLKKYRKAPQSIIEVGCGEGSFLALAKRERYQTRGIDLHSERIKKCRQRGLNAQTMSLLEFARTETEKFDVVYHVDLLSHFMDPVSALQTMSSLLKPDGVLFFEVGVLGGIDPWWYRQLGHIGLPYHLWLFSERSLQMLFERANLSVCAQSSYRLSCAVALGKTVRLLRQIQHRTATPLQERSHTWSHHVKLSVHMFARYKVGAWLPKYGPSTHLFLLRPT